MTVTAEERTQLHQLAELDRRPTAPQRVARTAGQAASAYVLLDLAEAFHWFGSATWTTDQWKAVTAAAVAVVAAAQNLGPKVPAALAAVWRTARGR